jgi:hypothetical protein
MTSSNRKVACRSRSDKYKRSSNAMSFASPTRPISCWHAVRRSTRTFRTWHRPRHRTKPLDRLLHWNLSYDIPRCLSRARSLCCVTYKQPRLNACQYAADALDLHPALLDQPSILNHQKQIVPIRNWCIPKLILSIRNNLLKSAAAIGEYVRVSSVKTRSWNH